MKHSVVMKQYLKHRFDTITKIVCFGIKPFCLPFIDQLRFLFHNMYNFLKQNELMEIYYIANNSLTLERKDRVL